MTKKTNKKPIKNTKKTSKLVKQKFTSTKQPRIEVIDIPLRPAYYRTTMLELDNGDKFFINWNEKLDFKRGLAKLQRHYHFLQSDIIDVETKTHRYASTTFIAKGFKP